MSTESRHQCLVYDGSPWLQLSALASLVQNNLIKGYRCLYLNSPPMVMGLRCCLASMGLDVVSEVTRGSLILSSEPVSVESSVFNIDSMLHHLEATLDQALSDGYLGLWATGDMTWEFGSEKNFTKLMEYEFRLEGLFRRRSELRGICQYHKDSLPPQVPRLGLVAHESFFVNETLSLLNPYYLPPGASPANQAEPSDLDALVVRLCRHQTMSS